MESLWFPVDFPLNQSIDHHMSSNDDYLFTTSVYLELWNL